MAQFFAKNKPGLKKLNTLIKNQLIYKWIVVLNKNNFDSGRTYLPQPYRWKMNKPLSDQSQEAIMMSKSNHSLRLVHCTFFGMKIFSLD